LGAGSKSDPYVDVKRALKTTGGGNTFIFKAGIYTGQINLYPEYSGTPQRPNVLKSEHKYQAVVCGAMRGDLMRELLPRSI
jgi:glycine betaine/choline ABC-type transport system substrate-binding protein